MIEFFIPFHKDVAQSVIQFLHEAYIVIKFIANKLIVPDIGGRFPYVVSGDENDLLAISMSYPEFIEHIRVTPGAIGYYYIGVAYVVVDLIQNRLS